MNITSLLRVRNGELLIEDTLEHLSEFSDEIYVFDDASTDKTVSICQKHPKVKKVLRNYFHNPSQAFIQTAQRKLLLDYARVDSKNQWFLSTDIDDRFIFNQSILDNCDKYSGISVMCFDAYMTKNNCKPYKKGEKLEDLRKYWGPEYRDIVLLFKKNKSSYDLKMAGQRQPNIVGKIVDGGYLKHYGKCLSVKQWEEKCKYYMKSMPMLAEKWEKRLGRAIHVKSDFDRDLLNWKEIISGEKTLTKI